jgi:sterol desaturase/sphingolipid hydroxylase (fatty acid hydroxylase superfamily)
MSFFLLMFAAIAASGVLLLGMTLLFHAPYGKAHRIREGKHGSSSVKDFRRNTVITSLLSLSTVALLTWLSYPWLFELGPVNPLRIALECLGVLMLYDFLYYFMHRFPFHEWKRLKKVHAVHHRVRNPSAVDSLYLHPVEALAGLILLWIATALVGLVFGPVSATAFGVAFIVYSTMNVLVHAGIDYKVWPLAFFSETARRHDKHHAHMAAGNYANLFPFWDRLFGTTVK